MTASLAFHTLDVFTDERFRGNPLAVLPAAGGLDTGSMQAIAREFNLSETVFVAARDPATATARVRIFTPRAELPFAGHPTIGTALLLARDGFGERTATGRRMVLEELAGPVEIAIEEAHGQPVRARLSAPGEAAIGAALDRAEVAAALGLEAADLGPIAPRTAGHGLAFLMLEVASLDALGRAEVVNLLENLRQAGLGNGAYLFTRATDDGSIRARLFAPLHGIAEDPATGSAAAGLAALLASSAPENDLDGHWRIVQGVEMGRRSTIDTTARKRAGRIEAVTVAGGAVPVSEGTIRLA